jgi:broad specificity phosphatase PhoE
MLLVASLVSCSSGGPDAIITLTFIRHGESAGNASGVVDTAIPGPGLTELGRSQAQAIAEKFSRNRHDGVFASSMVRTQQTADYLANLFSEPVTVLPGLREIEAGAYEGSPETQMGQAIWPVLRHWVDGHREVRLRGSIDGNEFDARFSDAVNTIYRTGDRNPIAFSHGGAIAVWTLMNVTNPQPVLLQSQPLPNTGYVVINGNPRGGWKLVDWDGTRL